MISDQIGKDPSVFLPSSMGRLIEGCEARATRSETSDAYRNGIERSVKPRVRRYANVRKRVRDLNPIRMDSPTPMAGSDGGNEEITKGFVGFDGG
ncbi:hypothetical protein Hanom_Chr08g00699101 [Helianthus anomalus]